MSIIDFISKYLHTNKALVPLFREKMRELQAQTVSVPDTSAYFLKDQQNDWWFIGVYSNKFEDRQQTILSSTAHEQFTEFIDKSSFRPVVTLWHEPRMSEKFWLTVWRTFYDDSETLQKIVDTVFKTTALAKTEKVLYLNGFAIVVAKVLPDKVDIAARLSKHKNLGMSHGFVSGALDDNIIDRYFSFEFTVLPRHRAANTATSGLMLSEVTERSDMAVNLEKRQFLENAFGPGIVEALEAETKENEEALELLLRFKDQIEDNTMTDNNTEVQPEIVEEALPEKAVVETAETPVETPEISVTESAPVTMQQMMEFMTPVRDLLDTITTELRSVREAEATQAQSIQTLTTELEILRKSEDEKIADQISPANFWGMQHYQASKAKDNVTEAPAEQPTIPESVSKPADPLSHLMTMAFANNK
jgi:hypothetical protein